MKTIVMQNPLAEKYDHDNIAVAIGFFDGIHLGHQQVIHKMIDIAEEKQLKKAVMTFDPHPSVVLNHEMKRTTYVTPIEEKKEIFACMGIDYLFIIPFTSSFANMSEQDFIRDYFTLNHVKHVIAGFDFTYGKYGKGNMLKLEDDKDGFDVTMVQKKTINDDKVSTTNILKALKSGETKRANAMLGRPYSIKGFVVQGEKRGRTIGFRTANVMPKEDYVIPKVGVHAVRFKLLSQNKTYNGVCNVGYKPTFNDPSVNQLTIEVNIFDFDESIYGESVEVEWYEFIRDEKKFDGIDSLINQIQQDVIQSKDILSNV